MKEEDYINEFLKQELRLNKVDLKICEYGDIIQIINICMN
jgi:hypothetical protein